MWSQWWELAAFGPQASFLGRDLGEWVWGEILHFALSESNLHYENICRVILLPVTWSTLWGGRDYCLSFPLGESEYIKVKFLYMQSFIESGLKPRFKVPLGCVTLGKSFNFGICILSYIVKNNTYLVGCSKYWTRYMKVPLSNKIQTWLMFGRGPCLRVG